MKKIILLLSVIYMTSQVSAQDSTVTPVPEPTVMESNQPYYFDIGTQATTPLEKLQATRKTQMKMFGLGGASSMYIIAGAQSAVMLPSADSMAFVISAGRLGLSVLGNSGLLSLYKLKPEGAERHAVIKEKKGLTSGDNGKSEKIEYITRRDGDKIVIVLSQKPPPGEYAFLSMKSIVLDKTIEVFCFRVE